MRFRAKSWMLPAVAGVVAGALVAVLGVWLWPDPPGLEEGELLILSGADDSVGKWRQTLVDLWNAEHPNTQARIEELEPNADSQRSQMIAAAETRTDVDIFNLDVTMLAEFAAPPGKDPFIRPIDESRLPPGFLDGFLEKPLATCRYEDELWALPFNTDAGLLFYRNDVVSTPPTTWDELVAMAEQEPAIAGYLGQLDDYEGLTVNALEAVWGVRGEVVNSENLVVAEADTLRTAFLRLMDDVVSPDARGYDENTSREAFARGEGLFMRNWPVQYSKLLNTDDPDVTKPQRVAFAITALPWPSALGGQNLAIAADTDQPRAAQAFIEFMTQESSQLLLARYGAFAPTRKTTYEDEALNTRYEYMPELRKSIEGAKPRPITPYYPRFSETFRGIVNHAMGNDGQPPADFVQRLNDALQGR